MKDENVEKWFKIAFGAVVMIALAAWGAMIAVGWHFAAKYW